MADQIFVSIGFTRKTHGVKGELKCSIEEDYKAIILKKGRVFLDQKGRKVPFFVEEIRGAGEPIVKFEDIDNREDALLLQSREIFLPENDLPVNFVVEDEDELAYAFVVGFRLLDQTVGLIGEIEDVVEMPQQEMAVVQYKGREVMIPLNEQFVLAIDEEKQEVKVDLPDGLLNM